MAKVAFLGLGVMGYPMAGHLKNKGGHDVTVYNRTAAKADQWSSSTAASRPRLPKLRLKVRTLLWRVSATIAIYAR